MKELKTIRDFESHRPERANFSSFRLKKGLVAKATGTYRGFSCAWDGFGLAYHPNTQRRFKSADICFEKVYRAVGRESDISMTWHFLVANGYKAERRCYPERPFTWECTFSQKAYDILLDQSWFLAIDADIFEIKQ